MTPSDPFDESSAMSADRTVILPRPGGGRVPPPPAAAASPSGGSVVDELAGTLDRQGLNPLEAAASNLLNTAVGLRGTPRHPDSVSLLNRLVKEVRAFQGRAQKAGVDDKTLYWAGYALCTTIDEIVLATPWGHHSQWSQTGLLNTFYKESQGGKKFFDLLARLKQNPSGNIHLLELMYLCLAFGFEGRYAREANGQAKLSSLRQELFQVMRRQKGDFERELSPAWEGVKVEHNPVLQYLPFWVVAAVLGLLLMLTFIGLSLSLNSRSDPVYEQLHAAGLGVNPVLERELPPVEPMAFVAEATTLTQLLRAEIEKDLLEVKEDRSQAMARLRGDGLFRSGKVDVIETHVPLLQRVAWALDQLDGRIIVTGHTDNVPIRSLRYPSNWHLSRARAESVAALITPLLRDAGRLRSEGRGAAEPLQPNDSRANRARNRRVEVTLLKEPEQLQGRSLLEENPWGSAMEESRF